MMKFKQENYGIKNYDKKSINHETKDTVSAQRCTLTYLHFLLF